MTNRSKFLISALFFTFAGFGSERSFCLIIGVTLGWQWPVMVTIWSFIIGGLIGRSFLEKSASFKRVLLVGVIVPTLTLYASCVSFGLGTAISNIIGNNQIDGIKQLFFSPFLGLIVAVSCLVGTFWLIWPVGVLVSWLLSLYGKMKRGEHGNSLN